MGGEQARLFHLARVPPAALLPLRESATLQSIEADAYPGEGAQGTRPVAEFWRAYDAHHAAGKK